MTQGAVLALDLATTTGWAWHRQGMPRPFFGAFRLPGGPKDVGEQADALEHWLRQLYIALRAEGGISHFFFEAQHLAAKVNIDTVYRLIALGGIVEKFAFQVGAKAPRGGCYKVHISEWRKYALGRGAGFKRDSAGKYLPGEDPKQLALQRCGEHGWHTDIADAAEAALILDYGISMIDTGCRAAGLPGYPRPWRDKAFMGGGE